MPNSVHEKHLQVRFTIQKKQITQMLRTFQGEDNAEQNSNKNSQEKKSCQVFFTKSEKNAIQ